MGLGLRLAAEQTTTTDIFLFAGAGQDSIAAMMADELANEEDDDAGDVDMGVDEDEIDEEDMDTDQVAVRIAGSDVALNRWVRGERSPADGCWQ